MTVLTYMSRSNRIRDVIDGTSNTLACLEIYRGRTLLHYGPNPDQVLTGRRCGMWIATGYCQADGSRAPNHPDVDRIWWSNNSLGDHHRGERPGSSRHEGGVHAALADGSVHFISENVDVTVLQNSCSRAGEEVDTVEF